MNFVQRPPRRSVAAGMLPLLPLLALLSALAPPLEGQTLPLLDRDTRLLILEEVSGDKAYEHIRHNTQFHRPRGGADGLMEVARYYEEKAREYGLSDVVLIKQDYWIRPWNASQADLWLELNGERRRLASTLETPIRLADYSAPADVSTELVDVGSGVEPEDYEGRDVAGKVVLAHGPLGVVHRMAVAQRGAAGVIWYPHPMMERYVSYPDQIHWSRLPVPEAGEEAAAGFAFILSLRQGLQLRTELAGARSAPKVTAVVDAAFDSADGDAPWQVMVEAFIPGTHPELGQDIVLTGHIQEEKFSANDDASGTASILEIGRALNRLIEEGRLERPMRNLRFWWVTEFSSQRQYFADHPEAHQRMWVNINQDMVGANQAQDVMRVQNVTRLPASRFHFFNDVVESVVDYMVAANNSELAQGRVDRGGQALYPEPHLSVLGTRHRYNAKTIFFHTSTDHAAFLEAPIGVPGITFTNWPDFYIHTSDDDLWNIDRTQLGRNAAAGALIAYAMGTASEPDLPVLAAVTGSKGDERLARNLGLGLTWMGEAAVRPGVAALEENGSDVADGGNAALARTFHDGVDQVRYAAWRERRAAASLSEVVAAGSDGWSSSLLERVDRWESRALEELRATYRRLSGSDVPARSVSSTERELEDLRPRLVAGPGEFLEGRGQISGVPGLHGLMAFEVLNMVDGDKSGLDILRLVAGQAREAGEHYYGQVEAEAVLRYLQNVEELGLITLR
jgi:hypothetical protein